MIFISSVTVSFLVSVQCISVDVNEREDLIWAKVNEDKEIVEVILVLWVYL